MLLYYENSYHNKDGINKHIYFKSLCSSNNCRSLKIWHWNNIYWNNLYAHSYKIGCLGLGQYKTSPICKYQCFAKVHIMYVIRCALRIMTMRQLKQNCWLAFVKQDIQILAEIQTTPTKAISQSLQASVGVLPWIQEQHLPFTPFPTHITVIYWAHTALSALLAVLLNELHVNVLKIMNTFYNSLCKSIYNTHMHILNWQ